MYPSRSCGSARGNGPSADHSGSPQNRCHSPAAAGASSAAHALHPARHPLGMALSLGFGRALLRRKADARDVLIERRNLVTVCRFAVKALVERGGLEPVGDSSEEFVNFAAILEQVLSHRLKGQLSWFGYEMPRCFWDYVRIACQRVPHNCLASVESMEHGGGGRAKGRAWIRMTLMEKRLGEYISSALRDVKTTRRFYGEGAAMLGDEALLLAGMFLALNSIDFSFCLKGEDLANENNAVIDYTPYLKYTQSYGTISSEGDDMRTLGSSSEDATPDAPPAEILANENSWYSRYKRLEQQYRLSCEQKCYLEELVRVREAQLAEATEQHTAGVQRQHEMTLGWRVKRQGMEATILALQAELSGFQSGHVKSAQDLAEQRRGVLRDATLSVDLGREAEDVLLAASKGEAEGEVTPLACLPAKVGHEHDPSELLSPTGEQEKCSLACFQRHPQTAKNQP
ncbi:RUN domain-containing protein 3B-like isoform X2 [Petromyzon marinus]|uniref:RUN domain-containing protein 3B-like isoform X2 n=1 Tax=Petromyzon marinus TaxID=7757 RepID=A0AAJ7TPT6_PETMA|nr:RUN domain-containing protein 3B-like isoform X2 [Petromyzon marinus]